MNVVAGAHGRVHRGVSSQSSHRETACVRELLDARDEVRAAQESCGNVGRFSTLGPSNAGATTASGTDREHVGQIGDRDRHTRVVIAYGNRDQFSVSVRTRRFEERGWRDARRTQRSDSDGRHAQPVRVLVHPGNVDCACLDGIAGRSAVETSATLNCRATCE